MIFETLRIRSININHCTSAWGGRNWLKTSLASTERAGVHSSTNNTSLIVAGTAIQTSLHVKVLLLLQLQNIFILVTVYNWCEVRMKMWVMNLGKPVNIPKLNEAMAIELGASLLGEAIIFLIAAGLLVAEYARQVRKETAKEAMRVEEMSNIQYTIQELYFQAERQDTQIRELLRTVTDLESRVVKVPWKGKPSEDPSHPPSDSDSIHDIRYNHRGEFGTPQELTYRWPEKRGVIFSAVAYLSKDVF